jgi:protein TonB
MPYSPAQPSSSRFVGFGVVVLFHLGIVYALVTALSHRSVDVVHAPIETKIIEAAQPPPSEPPPPPPRLAPPPPVFVPPPEIHIERPPPPPQSTAITTVTKEKPPAPTPAPVAAPVPTPAPAEPVRVQPRLDAGKSREPEYPPMSRRLGEQGSVILQVLVETDGRVIDSKLVESSGSERLDQAALSGVKSNYRFVPGSVDGKPAQMWYTFKFTWRLR